MQIGRHHTDHCVRFAIELDASADHAGIAREGRSPQRVRENGASARVILLREKIAAKSGLDTERAKETERYFQSQELLPLTCGGERDIHGMHQRDLLAGLAARAPLVK